jgi:hypothetical protein
MTILNKYLRKTQLKINKPTLTTTQVYTALSKKVTKKEIEVHKTLTEKNFLMYQTLMAIGIKMAINKADFIFKGTLPSDRGVVSKIKITLVKLLSSFTDKLKTGKESYDLYLEEASEFIERLATIGFGVKKENRDIVLLYLSKIISWVNAEANGVRDNFLWTNFGNTQTKEFNIYGEVLEVNHIDKPENGERVLLYTYEGMFGYFTTQSNGKVTKDKINIDNEGVLAYYDSIANEFLLDDGTVIIPDKQTKWISYNALTKSL